MPYVLSAYTRQYKHKAFRTLLLCFHYFVVGQGFCMDYLSIWFVCLPCWSCCWENASYKQHIPTCVSIFTIWSPMEPPTVVQNSGLRVIYLISPVNEECDSLVDILIAIAYGFPDVSCIKPHMSWLYLIIDTKNCSGWVLRGGWHFGVVLYLYLIISKHGNCVLFFQALIKNYKHLW